MPHPSLSKVLRNHKRKVTDLGRQWEQQECQCHIFAKKHPRAQLHQGHVVTGLETLILPKSHDVFNNLGASNAFFPSKRRLQEQHMDQFQGWLKHHQFPRDQRIQDEFNDFFEEWQSHRQQLDQEPRLTGTQARQAHCIPHSGGLHHPQRRPRQHALDDYCPNIYNQAAYNTWMDKKTFRMLQNNPQDMKEDMKTNTPPEVSKHYRKG